MNLHSNLQLIMSTYGHYTNLKWTWTPHTCSVKLQEPIHYAKKEKMIQFSLKIQPKNQLYIVWEKAAELNIILCYLPFYSPQLQPEEKIWKDNKREIASYKVNTISNYPKLKKKEKEKILSELVEKSFYEKVKSKTKWNKVLNNYIKPIIKKLNPKHNTEWEVQKIS